MRKSLSLKINLNKILSINGILFLKPICDLLYNVKILNYIIMGYAIVVLLMLCLRKRIIQKSNVDFVIAFIVCLYSLSFFRCITSSTIRIYIKIMSPIVLFFIGRFDNGEICDVLESLRRGYFITFLLDIFSLITRTGFLYWGNALTFKGFYYNKSDVGIALINYIMLVYLKKEKNIFDWGYIVLSIWMIILSNSRMSLILLFIELLYFILRYRENKEGVFVYINIKIVAIGVIISIVALYLLRYLGSTSFFIERGFISFQFNSMSDLLSGENTQGRSDIWIQLMDRFKNASMFNRIFGIDLQSNIASIQNMSNVATHSLYLGFLYSFGYCGIGILILFVLMLIDRMNKIQNRQLFFFVMMSLTIFLVNGISVNTHEYTDYTWNLFFFAGMLYTDTAMNRS